jgi:hypothetical protein
MTNGSVIRSRTSSSTIIMNRVSQGKEALTILGYRAMTHDISGVPLVWWEKKRATGRTGVPSDENGAGKGQ